MKSVFKKVALAAALVGAGFSASATPIVGIANLSFGLVAISLGEIDWNNGIPGANYNPGNTGFVTRGDFFTSSVANTGSFAGVSFNGLTMGSVQDMSQNPADPNYVPIGPNNIPNFLKFAAQPGWLFTANFLAPGDQGPFTLAQVGNNVSATLSLNGIACDTGGDNVCNASDDKTIWTGIFSAQYTNQTIGSLLTIVQSGGELQNNTWSATIEARAIPEPGSIALLGLGLVGLAAVRRRKSV